LPRCAVKLSFARKLAAVVASDTLVVSDDGGGGGHTLVQFDLLEWELAEGERFAGSLDADGRETIVEAIDAFG
jgi:hypothetical protein